MKHLVRILSRRCNRIPSPRCGIRSIRFFTDKTDKAPFDFQLPKPTWSVADLQLDKQHEPVSDNELRKLAKRACLDMDQLDDKTRQQLRQDLGNMMHMIEQVTSFPFEDYPELSDADIYDAPRGVTAAPLREDKNETDAEQGEVATKVWDSYLEPNTEKAGAHNYFSIETKREDPNKPS